MDQINADSINRGYLTLKCLEIAFIFSSSKGQQEGHEVRVPVLPDTPEYDVRRDEAGGHREGVKISYQTTVFLGRGSSNRC